MSDVFSGIAWYYGDNDFEPSISLHVRHSACDL